MLLEKLNSFSSTMQYVYSIYIIYVINIISQHVKSHQNDTAEELSRDLRKPTICICENKDADQLRGNREADQRLCFRY